MLYIIRYAVHTSLWLIWKALFLNFYMLLLFFICVASEISKDSLSFWKYAWVCDLTDITHMCKRAFFFPYECYVVADCYSKLTAHTFMCLQLLYLLRCWCSVALQICWSCYSKLHIRVVLPCMCRHAFLLNGCMLTNIYKSANLLRVSKYIYISI